MKIGRVFFEDGLDAAAGDLYLVGEVEAGRDFVGRQLGCVREAGVDDAAVGELDGDGRVADALQAAGEGEVVRAGAA